MPPLLVVTGPPGAGKSTVARLVTDRFEPSALVEGDAFFAFLARGASDARHVVVPAHRPEDVADQIVAPMADGSLRHEVRAP